MFGAFDISTRALNAQRIRLDTIASNIANVDTILAGRMESRRPYRRIFPTFQARYAPDGGAGVSVKSIDYDQSDFRKQFEPGNPAADAQRLGELPQRESFDGICERPGNDPGLRGKHYGRGDD